jgi:hypothetical protein
MNIYHLSRVGRIDYGEFDAFVVVAPSEDEARKFANEKACDEGKIWTDNKLVTCEVVGRARSAIASGILLGSFNAG